MIELDLPCTLSFKILGSIIVTIQLIALKF